MKLNFILGMVASLATILSVSVGAIRYMGRAGVIEAAARRLGVDLTPLVIPGEPPEGEFEYTDGGQRRVRFLRQHFAAVELGQALQQEANDIGDGYTTDDLVELARSQVSHHTLIEAAVEKPGGAPRRWRLLGEHLSDDELDQIIEERDMWPDPIKTVAQLEDDPRLAYAWILAEDATEEDRESLSKEIEQTFIRIHNQEPDALHFVVRNIEELKELESETVETYVKPWLKDEDNTEEET